jgi:pimeloyl-ACP methyl ester carboxylesterase
MKTLIILHGWQSSAKRWEKVKEIIEENGIRVICPNIPGFKNGNELEKPWNLDNYIDWFSDFVIQSKLEYPDIEDGFYLLGHSFGGRMTIKIASKKIFKLNGIILVSAAGIKRNQTIHSEIMGLAAKLIRAFNVGDSPISRNTYNFLRIFFYRYIIRKTDYLNAKGTLNDTIKNILAEDLKEVLCDISEPTKIIWGDKDRITPLRDAYLMKERIKNSHIDILKGIRHTPYLECPEKLANLIVKFINKV